ncbi:MAG: class I SAM-dependent methyltransferase [Deltaproteobacteria bacterium]|nr:class I SAM-dependent methyltransferase [Deltaproteobacteria bacterium]
MAHLHRVCPLCGTDNKVRPGSKYSKGEWKIKECKNCSFVYLENPPPYAELEENFAWEKTFAEETAFRRKRNPLLYWISTKNKEFKGKYLKRNKLRDLLKTLSIRGSVLEVGCAGGHILKSLGEGCVPFGIEISRQLARAAVKEIAGRGGEIINASSLDGLARFEEGRFDCVIMSAFLEHEVHPKEVLKEARRVLKPGGRLIIKVPNFGCLNRRVTGKNWCGFRYPDHVNYFTPSSLSAVLKGAGFSIEKFSFFDRLPTSDNMWLVASRPVR